MTLFHSGVCVHHAIRTEIAQDKSVGVRKIDGSFDKLVLVMHFLDGTFIRNFLIDISAM